jgi:signal transduction histidine kinase
VRSADFPFLADWFAISLRWLALFGMAAALAVSGGFEWLAGAVLLLEVLWNLFVTLNALQNQRLDAHRPINLAVDVAASLGLFLITGGLAGPLAWAGLLAVFSAGIYYEVRGALLTAAALTAVQVFLTGQAGGFSWLIAGLLLGFNLALGVVFGLLSAYLMRGLRRIYQRHVLQRKEADTRLQYRERRRMQALNRLFETLNATLDEQVVLHQALETSVEILSEEDETPGSLMGAIFLSGEDGLYVGSAWGLMQHELRICLSPAVGVLGRALQTGTTQMTADFVDDPNLGRLESIRGFGSVLIQPLKRADEAYGVLLFAHLSPHFFGADCIELLSIISQQVVVCMQNARLFEDLRQEKERILSLQDEARKKLARDLHDGPAQLVTGIVMRLGVARKLLEPGAAEAALELERTEKLARQAVQEMRHTLFTLRPLVLEAEGLTAALHSISTQMKDLYHQELSVDVDPGLAERLEPAQQTALFYLVEEAVNNARKHAQAEHISVRLHPESATGSLARLEIVDDGVGFDLNRVNGAYNRSGSLGMLNLKERAGALNGVLNIDSSPGKGTRVKVLLPLTEQAVKRIYPGCVGTG